MSTSIAQGLFLLAFWAPPLAVIVCAVMLVVVRAKPNGGGNEMGSGRAHAVAA